MDDGSWRTLGRKHLYESPWCLFRVDEVALPDGAEIEYGVEWGATGTYGVCRGGGDAFR